MNAHMLGFKASAKAEQAKILSRLERSAASVMSDHEILAKQIKAFLESDKRKEMLTAEEYYEGKHDILNKTRAMAGAAPTTNEQDRAVAKQISNVAFLPNNRIIDNQYARVVDMKVNYLLKTPPIITSENEEYDELLQAMFDRRFFRTFRTLGEDSLNGGRGCLYPYVDSAGEFRVKRIESADIEFVYADEEHEELEFAFRVFKSERFEGTKAIAEMLVEIFTLEGIYHFVLDNGMTIRQDFMRGLEGSGFTPYVIADGKAFNWGKTPAVVFRSNPKEIPLIRRVKSLQDAINQMVSVLADNMEDNPLNTILIIKNYDGADLGEFRRNLAAFGAVKVNDDGGIDTLTVEVNAENYNAILKILKNALIENARAYDAKDERLSSGTPNQMNIQSMYSDIDLDAGTMEVEYQAALEELLYFYNVYLEAMGKGSFYDEPVQITFKRDMPVSTSETISNIKNSIGLISTETLLSKHPFVDDVQLELERLKAEQKPAEDYPGFQHKDVTEDEDE